MPLESDLTAPILDGVSETSSDRGRMKDRLTRSITIALVFMCLEVIGGMLAGSLAIVADAAHVLSDVSGLAVSLFALDLMGREPSPHYTYGYHQAEVIGALTSVMLVWAMTGVLLVEAYNRLLVLQAVDGPLMVGMASIGLLVNLLMIFTLGHHHSPFGNHSHGSSAHSSHDGHDDNHHHSHDGHSHRHGEDNMLMRAAVIHIIGDVVQSLGVLLSAVLIYWQPFDIGTTIDGVSNWNYADPLATVMFSVIVMYTTMSTVRQCVRILMHTVPEDISAHAFEEKIKAIDNVLCVHDIHIWAIGSNNPLCTAHVVIKEASMTTHKCGQVDGVRSFNFPA
jgi:solute carrier family 30 (zinc transporter), member 2